MERLKALQQTDNSNRTILGRAINLINSIENDVVEMAVTHQYKPMRQIWEDMRLLALLSPSLGFLGTAIGMVQIFNLYQGTSISPLNDENFARGIKLALITTILGLSIRIVALYWRGYLIKKTQKHEKYVHETILNVLGIDIFSRT